MSADPKNDEGVVLAHHDEDDDPEQYAGEDVEVELALVGFQSLIDEAPDGPEVEL